MSAFDEMRRKEGDPAVALALLLPLMEYQPLTGNFIRRRAKGGHRAGTIVGFLSNDGYVRINIRAKGQIFFAHRLAWLFAHGEWPGGQIDHINGVKTDNRLANLRVVSNRGNQQNQQRHRDGEFVGVRFRIGAGNWQATIRDQGVRFHLGTFQTAAEAALTYQLALKDLQLGYAEMENSND